MNPFKEQGKPIAEQFQNWRQLYPRAYNKCEIDPSPIKELRNRCCDNTSVGRVLDAAQSTDFECNK